MLLKLCCWFLLGFLVELQSFTHKNIGFRISCQKDSLIRKGSGLFFAQRRAFDEEYVDDDSDIEDEDMRSPNSVRLFLNTIFQKLFFFGLEDDPDPGLEKTGGLKYRKILASKEFKDYKKNHLGNLFLTTDELVAQFISSRNQIIPNDRTKKLKKEDDIKQDDISSVTEITPRNPDIIEKKIAFLEKEINLLDISLAALEDEGDDSRTKEERLMVQKNKSSLEDELRSLKIHLITIREEEADKLHR